MPQKIRYRTKRKHAGAVCIIRVFKPLRGKIAKTLILILFLIVADMKVSGQIRGSSADTLKKAQSTLSLKDKKDKTAENQGKNLKKAGVKQVKGARPDMSKSRGARPIYIERQSGSGIPRGIGRPGGAIKPGKR
jgi:hypothetical protein